MYICIVLENRANDQLNQNHCWAPALILLLTALTLTRRLTNHNITAVMFGSHGLWLDLLQQSAPLLLLLLILKLFYHSNYCHALVIAIAGVIHLQYQHFHLSWNFVVNRHYTNQICLDLVWCWGLFYNTGRFCHSSACPYWGHRLIASSPTLLSVAHYFAVGVFQTSITLSCSVLTLSTLRSLMPCPWALCRYWTHSHTSLIFVWSIHFILLSPKPNWY